MTDTNQAAEADQDSPDDIAEAKELGWKDPAEWKGKPPAKGFLRAREWIEHSQKILPLVEKQLKKASERADKATSDLESYKRTSQETFSNLERMTKAALAEQRRQIEKEYAKQKEAAVEVGDKAKYNELVNDEKKDLADLAKQQEPPEAERKEPAKLPADIAAAIDTWKADNVWFDEKNRAMFAAAIEEHGRLVKEFPAMPIEKNLAKVTEFIKGEFPHKFKESEAEDGDEDEPRRRGSAVEGGSRLNGSGGVKSLFSKLPPEAKAQADKFIKEDGLFLEKGEKPENPQHLHAARERYAKSYEELTS